MRNGFLFKTAALLLCAALLTGCAGREAAGEQSVLIVERPAFEAEQSPAPETASPSTGAPEPTARPETPAPSWTPSAQPERTAQPAKATPNPSAAAPSESPAASAPAAMPAQTTTDGGASRIVALENERREESGLSPLRLDASLNEAAQTRAQELTVRFDNTRPDGSSAFTVSPLVQGESIAMGRALDAEGAARTWLESEDRAEGALNAAFLTTGIGWAEADGVVYWVQLFGDGEEASSATSDPIQRVLELVNEYRAEQGLSPLRLDDELVDAAAVRADELVTLYDHTRPDGSSAFTVSPRAFAENIAMGTNLSADRVVRAWMDSPRHRANILNGEYATMGVGRTERDGVVYWDQLFGY